MIERGNTECGNRYPEAGRNAPFGVQQEIAAFREQSAEQRASMPLLYWLLGSGTPDFKQSACDSAYRDRPNGQQTCVNCRFLFQEVKTKRLVCSQIAPYVSQKGWCRLWQP